MNSVLDIGTNTIRLVSYNEKGKQLFNEAKKSEILAFTENGSLTENGQKDLADKISRLVKRSGKKPDEIAAFATFAFRCLENKDEVIGYIAENTGIEIKVLSPEMEAECDYLGICDIAPKDGVGFDLGGGSCQIFTFENGKIKDSISLPLGGKKVATGEIIPDADKQKEINAYIDSQLSQFEFAKKTTDCLYAIGGTVKECEVLSAEIFKTFHDKDILYVEEIDKIKAFFDMFPNSGDMLKRMSPKRCDSIYCGMMVLKKLADFFGAKSFKISTNGVREGFLKLKD